MDRAALSLNQESGVLPRLRSGPARILAIGSSSTEGVGASRVSAAYPARLAAALRKSWAYDALVSNAGVGGEMSWQTLKRLRRALADGWPQLAIWQVGTNDALGGADEARFRDALSQGVAAARAAHVPLLLVDPQYLPQVKDAARYEAFVRIVAEEGAREHIAVFSRYALMKDWATAGGEPPVLSKDRLHMSDLGYECLAGAMAYSLIATTAMRDRSITN